MNEFWDPRGPRPSAEFRELLVEYSGIPEDRVIDHIEQIRSQAWNVKTYPCIGMYVFMELSMSQHGAYAEILESLRPDSADMTLLDLGCCLGQDIRKLVHDGASGRRLTGYDIEPKFFSVGYEAFQDKSHLQAQFVSGNFLHQSGLASTRENEGQESSDPSPEQDPGPRYDFIHAADVFHLWSWDKQIQAYTKAVLMLKDRPGCILFGRNTGVETARLLDQGPLASPDGDHSWLHDAKSMRRMLEQVAAAAGRELDVVVEEMPVTDERFLGLKDVIELGWTKRLSFTIRTI